jgi:hypothetical protein
MRFVVEPGPVTISAGTSAVDLVGSTVVDPRRSFFSSVEVG